MKVLIIKHIEIEGPGLIESYLNKERVPFQILNLEKGTYFPNLDFTHIVILGGPMNVYEEDRYPFLREEDLFIKEAIRTGKSILGICLGAQLIAKALGAKVFKAPIKEIGWYEASLTRIGSKDPFFFIFPETFSVFQWHEDTFEIPKRARRIVTSNPITNQAFRYGERVYGLQFHLEVTKEMIQEWTKTYQEEFKGPQPSLLSKLKILSDTELKIDSYTKWGLKFFKNFFGETATGGRK